MCFLDDGMADIPGLRGRNDGIMIGMVNDMRLSELYVSVSLCMQVSNFVSFYGRV